MRRSILAILWLSLLSALPAEAQQRPSLSSVDAAQKRTNAAICAKADADGDSYRPFVCDPRCDCLAPALLQAPPTSCQQSSPGVFDIAFTTPPSCSNGYCAGAGGNYCADSSYCATGQVCVASCIFNICNNHCAQPCTADAACPSVPLARARLSGVSAADSPNSVECIAVLGTTSQSTTKINSNDALKCLEQVEATTGCQ